MSAKSSSDPRVRRSRKWLQDALRDLAQERPYEAITVQEIAARAEVNRTTFYQHFRDKDELLDSILTDLLSCLFLDSDQYMADGQGFKADEAPPFMRQLFEEVGKDAGFFRHMLGKQGSALFGFRMVAAVEENIISRAGTPLYYEVFPDNPAMAPPDLVARFLAVGLVGSLSWWLDHDQRYSARQAADLSWNLTFKLGNWGALAAKP